MELMKRLVLGDIGFGLDRKVKKKGTKELN